jgi:hypothetical protein
VDRAISVLELHGQSPWRLGKVVADTEKRVELTEYDLVSSDETFVNKRF